MIPSQHAKTDRQTIRQTNKQTHKQTDRQTNRQTDFKVAHTLCTRINNTSTYGGDFWSRNCTRARARAKVSYAVCKIEGSSALDDFFLTVTFVSFAVSILTGFLGVLHLRSSWVCLLLLWQDHATMASFAHPLC